MAQARRSGGPNRLNGVMTGTGHVRSNLRTGVSEFGLPAGRVVVAPLVRKKFRFAFALSDQVSPLPGEQQGIVPRTCVPLARRTYSQKGRAAAPAEVDALALAGAGDAVEAEFVEGGVEVEGEVVALGFELD